MTEQDIAQITYEVNRAYCESIGDKSFGPWEDAPDWQKETNLAGVMAHLENSDLTPEQSHNNWLKKKEAEGWKYGPVKDPAKKEHPCFVPYEELPEGQRSKDYLFRQVVHSLKRFVAVPESV